MVRVEVVIAVDLGLAELPVGSPAWVQLHTAADAHQTLPQLMGEGKIAVLATPTVLVPDGFTAEVMVGAQAPPAAGGGAGAPGMGAAAGGPEAPAAGAGAVAHPEAFLQRRVWVTPRLQDDGKIMLTVELRFDELLGKVDANTEDISPVGTRSGTVRLLAVPGRPVLVSGLVRLGGAKGFVRLQEAGDKGAGALELVESFLVLTPRIVQDNRAQKPKTAY
jgi:hypothetical protein